MTPRRQGTTSRGRDRDHDCSSVELNHLTAIQLGNWDAVVLLSYTAAGPEKAHVASGHSATVLAAELLAV